MTALEHRPQNMALAQPGDFNREQIDLIKNTVAVGCNDLELALFLEVCKSTGERYLSSQTCYNPKQQWPRAASTAGNREAINAYIRALRAKNPEAKAATDAAYREANPTKVRGYTLRYYQANRAAVIARARDWAIRNPEKTQAYARVKSHRRRGVAMDGVARQYAKILNNDPCSYCGSYDGGVEIDHIIPVAGGGLGNWENLTRACRSCNGAKAAKSLLTFLSERAQ